MLLAELRREAPDPSVDRQHRTTDIQQAVAAAILIPPALVERPIAVVVTVGSRLPPLDPVASACVTEARGDRRLMDGPRTLARVRAGVHGEWGHEPEDRSIRRRLAQERQRAVERDIGLIVVRVIVVIHPMTVQPFAVAVVAVRGQCGA